MPTTSTGIAYDRADSTAGPDRILFIHAGIADRRMWQPQWERLDQTCDMVRLDLRGFGDSTTPPADGSFCHAQDVIDTMDEVGFERVHLVGSSFGAGVATEVALAAPARVASLVLCPPGGSLLATITDALQEFFTAERTALEAGDLDAAVEANVRAWLVGPDRTLDDLDPDVVHQVRLMQRQAFEAADLLGEAEEVEFDPPALERLAEVVVPVLVLVGGHDMDTTQDAAQRLAAQVSDLRTAAWPDVAHLPSLERPDRFTDLLQDWIVHSSTGPRSS